MAEGRRVGKYIAIGCGVALLIAIIGVVSCVGLCGACIGGGMMMTEGAVAQGTAFFGDLRDGNVEQAYNRMSENYRSANDIEAFRQTVEGMPIMTQQTGVTFMGRNINAGPRTTVRLTGMLTAPEGNATLEMNCAQVGELWFIDAVSVQGETFQGTQLPAPSMPMGYPQQSPFPGAPHQPQAQPPTDPSAQPPTDPSSQPPVQPPTDPSTQPSTQPPTDPSAQP